MCQVCRYSAEIGWSWGPAKGAARSPRRMKSQPAWSGGGGTISATAGFCRSCDLAVHAPKRRVDRAVLGACQRCSPLTQKYGKSAGMVWGQRDRFCDRRFWSVHTKLAPAANYRARFCSKVVGDRIIKRRSNFAIRRCQA
jgi:hypothetical protein